MLLCEDFNFGAFSGPPCCSSVLGRACQPAAGSLLCSAPAAGACLAQIPVGHPCRPRAQIVAVFSFAHVPFFYFLILFSPNGLALIIPCLWILKNGEPEGVAFSRWSSLPKHQRFLNADRSVGANLLRSMA